LTISDYKDNFEEPNANFERLVATTDDVTFWVGQAGTDTATTKFLNKGGSGRGFVLRPDKDVQIVSILDGSSREKLKGDPVTASGGAAFSRWWGQPSFVKMVIRPTQTNTMIRLLVI